MKKSTIFLTAIMTSLLVGCGSDNDDDSDSTQSISRSFDGDFSGTWIVDVVESGCGEIVQDSERAQIIQNEDSAVISLEEGGEAFTADIIEGGLSWERSFDEDGGVTSESGSIAISDDGVTGLVRWTWSSGEDSCSGTSTLNLTCDSAECRDIFTADTVDVGRCEVVTAGSSTITIQNDLPHGISVDFIGAAFAADIRSGACEIFGYQGVRFIDMVQCDLSDGMCNGGEFGPSRRLSISDGDVISAAAQF